MRRSWAYLYYDLALFAVLFLPLALASALAGNRGPAAVVYGLLLGGVVLGSLLIARLSKLSLRAYWCSLRGDKRED